MRAVAAEREGIPGRRFDAMTETDAGVSFTLWRIGHWPESRNGVGVNKLTGSADSSAAGRISALRPLHFRRGRPENVVARPECPGIEVEAETLSARFRLAPGFHRLPRGALAARILRALLRLHGPLPCRGLAPLDPGRATLRGRDARPRRAHRHAGARGAGVPRNLRRGLAGEVRA